MGNNRIWNDEHVQVPRDEVTMETAKDNQSRRATETDTKSVILKLAFEMILFWLVLFVQNFN